MRCYLVKLWALGYSIILMSLFIAHISLDGKYDKQIESIEVEELDESEVLMSDEKNMMQPDTKSVHQHVEKVVLDNG